MAKCKKSAAKCAVKETAVKCTVKAAAPKRRAVTFEVKEAPGRSVMLAGSFNDWQPNRVMEDKNNDGTYRCRLMLEPGEYQYKFYIEGEWRADSANPAFVPNEFGSINSLLIVEDK